MVNRVLPLRLSTKHEWLTKANVLKLFRRNPMLCYVLNSIFGPNYFVYHMVFTIFQMSPRAKCQYSDLCFTANDKAHLQVWSDSGIPVK